MSDEGAWHARAVDEVLRDLETSREGLSPAAAAERVRRDGPNELPVTAVDPWWRILLRQFSSIIILLLSASIVVTAALQRWVDAAAIFVALFVDIALGFTQERKAARDVAALRLLTAQYCHARRAGAVQRIAATELVVGDLVVLESGDRVPADLRLIDASRVLVDESSMTGESVPVEKHTAPVAVDAPLAERSGSAWAGTLVVAGRATGVVVATGSRTELGAIDSLVRETDTPTPLQRVMRRFEGQLGLVVGAFSILVLVLGLSTGLGFADSFLNAVSLAVAAIPEGLPVVLTIALSLGVSRMARRRAIVRTLPAVEALGSTTVIASDKTGTMTLNRMTVERVWSPVDAMHLDGVVVAVAPLGCGRVLRAGALTNDAHHDTVTHTILGDPVDVAIARAALGCGVLDDDEFDSPPRWHVPYEPDHRCSRTVRAGAPDTLIVKGAPDLILSLSSAMQGPHGPVSVDDGLVTEAHDSMAAIGMRVLAVAERPLRDGESPQAALADLAGLEFLGLFGMSDPPRPGVEEAIAACRGAGITVMMITGDHPRTAAAIGARLGLGAQSAPVTGAELDLLEDSELVDRLRSARIAARVSPGGKSRIVRVLEQAGDIVAVTGDGVNDAPALRAASLGVALGRSGTDVARDAADIVLTDDDFSTIVHAVSEGRITFAAVQKATFFLISTGAAALVAVVGSLVAGAQIIFLPVQMIWFNLVSNGAQDVGLAFERGDGDELTRPPRPRSEGLLSPRLWARVVLSALWMGGAVLATFQVALHQGLELDVARTLALTAFAFLNFFHTFSSRSMTRSVFRQSPVGNRLLFVAAVGSLVVQALAVSLPVGRLALGFAPLSGMQWLVAALIGVSALIPVEADKALVRLRKGQP